MIFVDIDGVLAEFCGTFSRVIRRSDPTMPIITTSEQPDWGTWGGEMTDERLNLGWEAVKQSYNFWESLAPLAPPEAFRRLAAAHKNIPILFVTSRIPTRGRTVQQQCINWLEAQGIRDPLVIVAGGTNLEGRSGKTTKADIARIWNPYMVIEDSPQNAMDYAMAGYEVALMDWPYTADTRAPGIHRMPLAEAFALSGIPAV